MGRHFLGLFADGTSNYGGSWNGVNGSVKGLFYGDPSQLVAQLIGLQLSLHNLHPFISLQLAVDGLSTARCAQTELEGLDLPEMGALGTGISTRVRWTRRSVEVGAAD